MTNKTVYSHMLNYFYFIEIFDMWENDLRFFLHGYLHEATQSFTAFSVYLYAHHFYFSLPVCVCSVNFLCQQ